VSVDSTVARGHQHGATAPGRIDKTPIAVDPVFLVAEPGAPHLASKDVLSARPLTGGTIERQGFA